MVNAVRVKQKDNVATAIVALNKGEKAVFLSPEGNEVPVVLKEDVPVYHKYALVLIPKGSPVIKYGEHIGVADCDIEQGQYVHIHNVSGRRENLRDKRVE